MRTVGLVFVGVLLSLSTFAQSAFRFPGERWQAAAKRVLNVDLVRSDSALKMAVLLKDLDRSRAFEFTGGQDAFIKNFLGVRNSRFINDPEVANFKRRLSWLYPDDGCFMRAEWMARLLNSKARLSWVNKLFVFGDLEVKTPNHPQGIVRWWYHVVAAMSFNHQIYVYDPAINPKEPMLLEAWSALLGKDTSIFKFSICKSGTFGPSNDCDTLQLISDPSLLGYTNTYLKAERARLVEMGRDPVKELGDNPPWRK